LPSRNFFFAYDTSRPAGDRVIAMRLDGRAIRPAGRYKVALNNFLASGGDNFTVLEQVPEAVDVGLDLDALEQWLKAEATVPTLGRIDNRTPLKPTP
jgi:5'-nucleotidase